MSLASLLPGFADPVHDSQVVFRDVLGAMSHPGRIVPLDAARAAPAPLYPTSYMLCLTLLDVDTRVWLDPAARQGALATHLAFHCGCPIVDSPSEAQFALIGDPATMDLRDFNVGTDAYPDRSTTLIIQVESLEDGEEVTLSGPGIATTSQLRVLGLPAAFVPMWHANHAFYPRGVDVILCSPRHVVGLPRTCHLEV